MSDEPEVGFFKTKLVSGGPWVAVHIWDGPPTDPLTGETLDRSWRLQALVNDEPEDPTTIWPGPVPIPQEEYDYLLTVRAWALEHNPDDPAAAPRRRIDMNKLPPIKF